jgi:hypothetical protein
LDIEAEVDEEDSEEDEDDDYGEFKESSCYSAAN